MEKLDLSIRVRRNSGLADKINELTDENEKLKQEIEKLRRK